MQEIADLVQSLMVSNRQRFVKLYFPNVLALVEELHADRQLASRSVRFHLALHGLQERVENMRRADVEIEIPLVDRLDLHRNAIVVRFRKPRAESGHASQQFDSPS